MLNVKNFGVVVGVTAFAALSGCAQLKNKPYEQKKSQHFSISGGSCGAQALKTPEGARGLIAVQLLKNHMSGELQLVGKAVVTKEPFKGNYYEALGLVERTSRDSLKGFSAEAVGGTIGVSLGKSPVTASSEHRQFSKSVRASTLRSQYKAVRTQGSTGSAFMTTLKQDPKRPAGIYVANYTNPTVVEPLAPVDDEAGISASTDTDTAVGGGVGPYKTFLIDSEGLGSMPVSVPSDPESSTSVEGGEIGKSLKFKIAPDHAAPSDAKSSRLIVQLVERKQAWMATCVTADKPEGGDVEVPTTWKDATGKEQTLTAGSFYAVVLRSQIQEAGNKIYVDAGSGFVMDGSLKAAEKNNNQLKLKDF